MATVAGGSEAWARRPDALSGTSRAHGLDRWIFVAMAIWYIGIVLIGFVPSSIAKVGMVQAGVRPAFPAALHIHAVLMGAFLSTILVQSWLVATGRRDFHVRLGIAGFILACAVVGGGLLMVPAIFHQTWDALQIAPPEARARLEASLARSESLLVRQFSLGILFTLFMTIAFRARKREPGLHKRMIFLATAIAVPAGLSRMTWLPVTPSFTTADLYSLVAIAPLFTWDIVRNGRVHKAYWIWLAACLPFVATVHLLADSPWWHSVARQIMGV